MVRFLSSQRERRTPTNSWPGTKVQTRHKSPFNPQTFPPPTSQSRWFSPPPGVCANFFTVEHSLPKKREYILYAPVTHEQNELYQSILEHDIRSFLENKHLSKASSTGTSTPRKRKSESPDEEDDDFSTVATPRTRSGLSSTVMSRSSSSRSMRKRPRTSYREMTDSEWYEAMEQAEKTQFKDDYTPSPEVQKLTSTSKSPSRLRAIITCRKILGKPQPTKYDYATSKGGESPVFVRLACHTWH